MSFFTECILSKCVILCAHCISVCLRKTVSCTGIHYSFLSLSLWHMNSVYFLRFLKMFQKIHWKFIFKLNQYIDAENKYLTSSFGYFFIFVLWFFDSAHHTVQNQITFYCHSTCALLSEILESVLQTVQKQFTYRQYILTDLNRRQCAEYTYI